MFFTMYFYVNRRRRGVNHGSLNANLRFPGVNYGLHCVNLDLHHANQAVEKRYSLGEGQGGAI